MNNDLISREALKKHKFPINIADGVEIKEIEVVPVACIDSAPTVFSCHACKNMGNERECVDCHDYSNYVHYDERPQGEWKVYAHQGGIPISDYCTNCKYEMKWYRNKYNYCPNCGAKMKGGAEQ